MSYGFIESIISFVLAYKGNSFVPFCRHPATVSHSFLFFFRCFYYFFHVFIIYGLAQDDMITGCSNPFKGFTNQTGNESFSPLEQPSSLGTTDKHKSSF